MLYFLTILIVLVCMILFVSWFERSNVYFPEKELTGSPDEIGLSYKDVYFRAEDGVELHGWFIPSGRPPRATFLFCHGNAGNIYHRLEIIKILNALDVNVFIFDYRGYGNSKGTPSETGTYYDAMAAYKKLLELEKVNKNYIIIYGRSLGGAVAIDLAGKVDVKGIIIDSAFTSTGDMAKEVYPFIPIKLSLWVKYDNLSKIGKIKIPKLIIHSKDDEIVPFHQGKELFEKAAEPKDFYRMQGGHNDAMFVYSEEYMRRLDEFIRNIGIEHRA
ncbi:MAG: alpha/beta hydrolase [Candidatus Omnitrophota bacterium]